MEMLASKGEIHPYADEVHPLHTSLEAQVEYDMVGDNHLVECNDELFLWRLNMLMFFGQ